jgi:hypothetical protein
MTNIAELMTNSDANFNITIQKSDLIDFANFMISKTKTELEAEVIAAKAERYVPRLEACDILKIDQATAWRWAKRGYLTPIEVGGKRMYRMSDLKRILGGN